MSLIDDRWAQAREQIEIFRLYGAKGLFANSGTAHEAFDPNQRSLTCGDEGIQFGIHLPGSGVLIDEELRRVQIRLAGITTLTTHDNCGAFALAFPDSQDPNADVQKWGRAEALALGLNYQHIRAQQMRRDPKFHDAAFIYYDGTGGFNPTPQLPPGFVVSRRYFSDSPEALILYAQIAFTHGFGDRFTPDTPLCVIVLGGEKQSATSLEKLLPEAQAALRSFGSRVAIDGLPAAWYYTT